MLAKKSRKNTQKSAFLSATDKEKLLLKYRVDSSVTNNKGNITLHLNAKINLEMAIEKADDYNNNDAQWEIIIFLLNTTEEIPSKSRNNWIADAAG